MNREEILEIMLYYDKKGDNKIDVSLVGTCLRALGLTPTQTQIEALTKQWKDKHCRISLEEFLPIYNNLHKEKPVTNDELLNLLANFGREGNGFINITDLRFILINSGEKLTEAEADILLQGHENDDGKVNISEFVRSITSI
uniref:EF-hand domain-containing protein n=1 Tax=Panagrolaimus sp. JU765 TaxID=591449 RepID=A0AC34QSD3_9BILA